MLENYYMLTKDAIVVVVTLGVFALVSFVYLKLRPTIILKPDMLHGTCPDRWMMQDGECTPLYPTQCKAFNPEMYKGQECEIARSCGTSWKGLCN
jgi:hypothetical protein